MNGDKSFLLLDTNIIIRDLGQRNSKSYSFIEDQDNNIAISIITRTELLGYYAITPQEETKIRTFLEFVEIVPITVEISDIAIFLKRRYEGLKLPDSFIVATAIHHNIPLVTADKKLHKIDEVVIVQSTK